MKGLAPKMEKSAFVGKGVLQFTSDGVNALLWVSRINLGFSASYSDWTDMFAAMRLAECPAWRMQQWSGHRLWKLLEGLD